MKPKVHKLPPKEKRWLDHAIAAASEQSEDAHGEQIDFWLQPVRKVDFDGEDITTEDEKTADGPYGVVDPRLNHGTITDEEVFAYVQLMYGEPPLMFVRHPWGHIAEDPT